MHKTKKQRKFEKSIKIKNKKILKRYPFLQTDDWKGNKLPKKLHKYRSTLLDDMPRGWRKAFGFQLLEELRQELVENNFLDKYYIFQIKEKFGGLRWYDNFNPKTLMKYEKLSFRTCIRCGKPATKISMSWINPWCDDCAKRIRDTMRPIEEYI